MKLIRQLTISLVLSGMAVAVAEAREMRVSSFEPPVGFYSSKVLQPWIEKMNGQLSEASRFKLYPGSILGGAPAQAELVAKGVADVALVVPNYTPGIFPLSSIVELPGIAPNAKTGANVMTTLYEEGALATEYKDYKVIALFSTAPYRIFTKDEGARSPDVLNGMKVRTPSPFISTMTSMLGGTGVSIPAPQVYENLERGVVGGAVWASDAYKTFRLYEVAPKLTLTRITASPMAILMNRKTYEALPESDRKAIDEFSGRLAAEWIAGVIEEYDAAVQAEMRANPKVEVIDLTPAEQQAWEAALAKAPDTWVSGLGDKADAARKAIERAKALNIN